MADQTTARTVRPTTPADLWRLAEQGRRNGVRILTECVSGEHFATSASEPGTLYRLTAYTCTCKGFVHTGRCQHHSLLLAELGWLPDLDTDPEPPTPAAPATRPCDYCHGSKVEWVNGKADEWFAITCPLCDGTGEVEDGEPGDAYADTSRHDAPYDSLGPSPRPRNPLGLTDRQMVVLKGQAARLHAETGWPLVDFITGNVIAA